MTTSQRAWHIEVCGPLGDELASYDRKQSPGRQESTKTHGEIPTIDQKFLDAMVVREEVFVLEQGVPLENELDDDDASCVHLVLYTHPDAKDNDSKPKPAGTIRIVPQHTTLHTDFDKHRRLDGSAYDAEVRSTTYKGGPYIKLGRLAVVKQERGHGYADALVRAALTHAASHPEQLRPPAAEETSRGTAWDGLVLIHAQVQVQKFWAKSGFKIDEGLGLWDEEGIDHVAMWHRIPLATNHGTSAHR